MEWLYNLFLEHSALQAVVVLSLISAIGLGLGRVHFWGVSLGVTFFLQVSLPDTSGFRLIHRC